MARKTKPAKLRKAYTSGAAVTVRHYCQGIGDSHLLRFAREGGDFWVLIACVSNNPIPPPTMAPITVALRVLDSKE